MPSWTASAPRWADKTVPPSNDTLLTFTNVTLGYGRRVVLRDLSFSLGAGDYVGIVGPNGAGKTTLLRAILGAIKPQAGIVTARKARPLIFGYVPQANSSDDHFPLTVLDIVLMGTYRRLGLLRRPGKNERDAGSEALAQVGLPGIEQQLFRELSGGQKQRVLVARALMTRPDVLAMDEPTASMDVAAEHATMELVDRLHAERPDLLVLIVSHALNSLLNHVQQVGILGDGRFEIGPVDAIVRPERLRQLYNMPLEVARFGDRRMVL
jgi:ABC-type Mn2+/Zn2+ transport system ATPase subunit